MMIDNSRTNIKGKVGIGLRNKHHEYVLKNKPDVAWFEVHSENFFSKGSVDRLVLQTIAKNYPLSFHGVGLSLGSAAGIDLNHLKKLKQLVDEFNPILVSEHVSWSRAPDGTYVNDLLPIPYTEESLKVMITNVNIMQDSLGRRVLLENPSTYLEFNNSTMTEHEFLRELVKQSGCGILLDVNNIYVSCVNHRLDANAYLKSISNLKDDILEIHLAGHAIRNFGDKQVLIDHHGSNVVHDVWQLYKDTVKHIGAKASLIEWDTNIPEFDELLSEADKAANIIDEVLNHV